MFVFCFVTNFSPLFFPSPPPPTPLVCHICISCLIQLVFLMYRAAINLFNSYLVWVVYACFAYLILFAGQFACSNYASLPPVRRVSPLQLVEFQRELVHHPDQLKVHYVLDGIEHGFVWVDRSPLTAAHVNCYLREILSRAGVSGQFSSHSFRIGAATSAAAAGIPDHLIQTLGRWTTQAYLRYIRTAPDMFLSIAPLL